MNESYKDLKAYLLNEIAEDARGVLNAIEGKKVDKVDDEEVLCFCHDLAFAMTTLETVAHGRGTGARFSGKQEMRGRMSRKDVTEELSKKVEKKLRRQFSLVAQEVWVDPDHRVDFMAFSPGVGGRNMKLEHGRFVFVEVKSCMADFKSGHGLTFRGDDNWLVCPRDLADELHDKMLLPLGVQVYCPDNGGSLRLRYDLSMRGAGSLREDSTLCLLWAMLMDSYTRWRTTGGVFVEASD